MKKNSVIYFIYNDKKEYKSSKIVYIGVDSNSNVIIPSAMNRHLKTFKNKLLREYLNNNIYDYEVAYKNLDKKEAHELERKLINEFKPKFNRYCK